MNKVDKEDFFIFGYLTILALSVFIMINNKSAGLIPIIAIFLMFVSIFNLKIGLFSWLLIAPLSSIISDQIQSFPNIILPLITFGLLVNLVFRKQKLKVDYRVTKFFILVFSLTLLTTFLNQHYSTVNIVIAFSLNIINCYLLYLVMTNYDKTLLNVVVSLTLAALVAMAFSFTGEIVNSTRLNVGGSIRTLSNILGFASILLISILFTTLKQLNIYKKVLIVCVSIILICGVILTVSRGVIASVIITFIGLMFFNGYVKRSLTSLFKTFLIVTILISFVFFIGFEFFVKTFESYYIMLERRLASDQIEGGTGVRQYIWQKTLNSYSYIELLIGIGIDGFRYKSNSVGLPFYAHSTFIDILASSGIITLVTVISTIIKNAFFIFKNNNVIGFGLLLYTIISHLTHGSVTSVLFWIGVSIVMATNKKYFITDLNK